MRLQQIDSAAGDHPPVLRENRDVLTHDINNLADVTTTLLQPEPRERLGSRAARAARPRRRTSPNFYDPPHGAVSALPAIA